MEERRNGQKNQDDVNDAKLKKLVADLDGTNCCLILCAKKYIGDWLNVQYNMVTWKRLAAKYFCCFNSDIIMITPLPPIPTFIEI